MPTPSSEALTDPAAAANLSDSEWVNLHVPRFVDQRGRYEAYQAFLEACLPEICRQVAPMAMVSARAKAIASMAEKILRKRSLYQAATDPLPPDPLVRMTDLCGCRIIAETGQEVRAICEFIEEAFDIDRNNSEDVGRRLKPTEFGYRSVHYIIMVNPEKLARAGIMTPVPPEILRQPGDLFPLKAEAQVRTLLEHAWSDLGHDLLYKSENLQVPDRMKRHFARVAAVLEGADREFGQLINEFRQYRASPGFHHKRSLVDAEIGRLLIVLNHDQGNVSVAMRAAAMALAVGRHKEALAILEQDRWNSNPGICRLLGIALTELHWNKPESDEFRRGREQLERCAAARGDDFEALLALAECELRAGRMDKARTYFHQASRIDPTHPAIVCRYLEFETGDSGARLLDASQPMICAAIDRASKLIEARVHLPTVWSAVAILRLMQGKPFDALHALAKVIGLCRASRDDGPRPVHPCAAGRALQRTRDAVNRLRPAAAHLAGFEWFERFLNLGLVHLLDDEDARTHLHGHASQPLPAFDRAKPVLILAGACSEGLGGSLAAFGEMLLKAAEGAAFNLVSGGTRDGVSGLAGDLAAGSGGRIRGFGYRPANLPPGVSPRDTDPARYAEHRESPGEDFTPLEPLQAWTDLTVAEFDPRKVRLLCYAPGDIARTEISIALGLGARAGLVMDPAVPEDRGYDDSDWIVPHEFLPLPYDLETLRAFLNVGVEELAEAEKERLEKAAKKAHEAYVASARPTDPSLKSWEKLDESLKESNYQQVAFWKNILLRHGLELVPFTGDPGSPLLKIADVLSQDQIDTLAQLEHGRWNVERLSYGWRHGKEKDVAARLSPYLIPWENVPKNIQEYDVKAILALPANFREAGLDLRKTGA